MRVLLTGATGFVGRHVATALVAAGHEPVCLVRDRARAAHLVAAGLDLLDGGMLDRDALRDGATGAAAVVHVAGLVAARSRTDLVRVNATGSGLLAAACREATLPPRRFVLVSSQAAGGPSVPGARPVREDDEPRPVSGYGASKLAGERAVRKALPDETGLTIVRPPAVYGPHDRGILEFFRAAARGIRLRVGSVPRRVSIVHVEDLARGIVAALETERAAGRTYYVANEESHAMDALLAAIADAVGRRGLPVGLPDAAVRAAGVVAEEVARLRGVIPTFSRDKVREFLAPGWECDAARAREELGWAPRHALADGLRATAAWYREHGWI